MKLSSGLLAISTSTVSAVPRQDDYCSTVPNDVIDFLKFWGREVQPLRAASSNASWNWNIDINPENEKLRSEASAASAAFTQKIGRCAIEKFQNVANACSKSMSDENCTLEDEAGIQKPGYVPQLWTKEKQLRALKQIQNIGTSILSEEDYGAYQSVLSQMGTRYSTAKVPDMNDPSKMLELEPDLTALMFSGATEATKESFESQKYYWEQWWNTAGQGHEDYDEFVKLSNKAAQENGFTDTGDMWRLRYEDDNFKTSVEFLWQKIKPFYEEIHAYVRFKLRKQYGSDLISENGPMPAHIFGNMWSQSWAAIYDHVVPYPDAGVRPDATQALQEKTEVEMFEMSDDFFQGLGCTPMTDKFWEKSVLKRADGGDQMVCHASAWDFQNGNTTYDGENVLGMWENGSTGDYRVKQCTVKTQKQFVTVHHEMGHIQYYQQYAHQPIIFRTGANPGFHEAVGDTIALSVNTPEHLYKVGLLPDFDPASDSLETDVNYLMSVALDKIAFMPFGYLMDLWRWDVFDGTTPSEKYQERWDELRLQYQGIVAPVERTSANFDPAAKFHIPNNTPYIRYFISHILQFQFYRSMCEAADLFPKNPLYKCDFDGNEAAGKKLNDGLMMGMSEDWRVTLKAMTGEEDNNAQALLDYFEPLINYLEEQRAEHNYPLGWDASNSDDSGSTFATINLFLIFGSLYFSTK